MSNKYGAGFGHVQAVHLLRAAQCWGWGGKNHFLVKYKQRKRNNFLIKYKRSRKTNFINYSLFWRQNDNLYRAGNVLDPAPLACYVRRIFVHRIRMIDSLTLMIAAVNIIVTYIYYYEKVQLTVSPFIMLAASTHFQTHYGNKMRCFMCY